MHFCGLQVLREAQLRRLHDEQRLHGWVWECEHTDVAGRGIFMEELLAELERRGVKVMVEEIGKDRSSKRMNEAGFGSMPGIAPFRREEIDRFDS